MLVADDQPAMRLLCRVNLECSGMIVSEAVDGPSALVAARADHPDVILLDGMLPGLDGWAVATALQDDASTESIPIIFLSAHAELSRQAHAIELGAVAYVTKPFDPVALAAEIERLLAAVARGESDEVRADELNRIDAASGAP